MYKRDIGLQDYRITGASHGKNVDEIKYEAASMDTTPFTVGLTSMMYQTYAGTAQHVEINVCDADTGEILFAAVYPDAMES